MAKLIYVQGSPRVDRSYSDRVAQAFVDTYQAAHPADTVVKLDVFGMNLPVFDGFVLGAKYRILHGEKHTAEEAAAWKAVESVISQFTAGDKFVFSVPMWNFGIPYRLKQFFDVIAQPGYTFSFSPGEGFKGLITGKPALVVYARGGEYGGGDGALPYDFQKRYVDLILGFMGITNVQSLLVEPTEMAGKDTAKARLDAAVQKAREIAKTF